MERLGVRASLPAIVERPEIDDGQTGYGGWIVTVYDNDKNTFEEVIYILMAATGCDFDEAQIETWEIDNLGRSVVHHGEQDECEKAAGIIAQIGIEVKVSQE